LSSRSFAVALGIAVLVAGCDGASVGSTSAAEVDAPSTDGAEPVQVVWVGCDEVRLGRCLFFGARSEVAQRSADAGRELRVWVDVPLSVELSVAIDGRATPTAAVSADAGTRLHVPLPDGAELVEVSGPGVYGRLGIEVEELGPGISAAREALESARVQDACRHLALVGEGASWADRMHAAAISADRCNDGTAEDLVRGAERFAEVARQGGFARAFARAASMVAFHRLDRLGDVDGAAAWIDRMEEYADALPEVMVWTGYYRLLLLDRTNAYAEALASAARAQRWGERLGMTREWHAVLEMHGVVLARLGRVDAALELAALVRAESLVQKDECQRARMMNNAAWIHQLLAQAELNDETSYDDLVEIETLYRRNDCRDPRNLLHARINAAKAALEEDELESAREWLQSIDLDDPNMAETELRMEYADVAAAIALGTGSWELYPRPLLVQRPVPAKPRLEWQAAVREAQLLERFGLLEAAVDEWKRAEDIVEASVSAAGRDRDRYITGRERSIRGLAESLVRANRIDEAMCRVRLARGRALRRTDRSSRAEGKPDPGSSAAHAEYLHLRAELARDASEDWKHAGDELERRRARRRELEQELLHRIGLGERAEALGDCGLLARPRRGELVIVLFPVDDATLVFSDMGEGAQLQRTTEIPRDAEARARWAGALVESLADVLTRVGSVRVLPVGRGWDVEVHAARWGDAPLVSRLAVSYGLDLPQAANPDDANEHAVLVADPSGDLPHAMDEITAADRRLSDAGWDTEHLVRDDATRGAVLAALERATLFHYAGHGRRRDADGREAALLLADGGTIEVNDVLALSRVPRWVALTGCETDRFSSSLLDGGSSLGRAFLLAGSEAVIVSDRDVGDELARAIGAALYDVHASPARFDPGRALARAQADLAGGSAPLDWSAFRMLTR